MLSYWKISSNIGLILHVFFQFIGFASIIVGLLAIKKDQKILSFSSIHSWIGLISIILFFHNFTIGLIRKIIKTYFYSNLKGLKYHQCIGLITLILISFSISSGVISFQEQNCVIQNNLLSDNPANNYKNILYGCKISNGNKFYYYILINIYYYYF